ncbi:MAG: hypothetical protein HY735_13045 [Verrucomicrobia bacterium]|nr:hypothetical protein [Verrucomicrobiota bacterium]
MRKELADLLQDLVQRHRRVERQIDERFNQFKMPASNRITDYVEFQEIVTRFFWQLYRPEVDIRAHWGEDHEFLGAQAFQLLQRAYGPSAMDRAFDLARSGAEGGTLEVLRKLAGLVQELFLENQAAGLVDRYWTVSSAERLTEDAKAYLERFQDILPGDLTEGSGAAIRANFRKVLLEHPKLILRLQRIGRC